MANVSTYNCGGCGGGGGNAYPALSRLFVNSIEPCTVDGKILMNQGQLVVDGEIDTTTVNGKLQVNGVVSTTQPITLSALTVNGNITQTSGTTSLKNVDADDLGAATLRANEINFGYSDQVRFVSDEDKMGFYITDEDGLTVSHFTNNGIDTQDIQAQYIEAQRIKIGQSGSLVLQTGDSDDTIEIYDSSESLITTFNQDGILTNSLTSTTVTSNGEISIKSLDGLGLYSGTTRMVRLYVDPSHTYFNYGGNLYFKTSNTNRFTISYNGDWIKIGTSGALIGIGAGSPLNTITAPVGSMFLRTDGSGGTTLYVKESGTDASGWKARNEFSTLNCSGSLTANDATLSSLSLTGDLAVDTNVLKVNSSTNKVGINITSPAEALDVVGNIKASGTTQCVSLIQTTPALLIQSNNINQAIAASTATTVLFGSTSVNDQSVITYSATPGTWTSNAARVVQVSYTILWANNGTAASNRQVYIQTDVNCTPPNSRLGEVLVQSSSGSSNTVISGTAIFKMPINGTFTIKAWQNSTASCNITTPSWCHVLLL